MAQLPEFWSTIADVRDRQAPFLDTIDQLQQHHINSKIDFPRWIVVGDQNTGKSSVMEAISRIPFPIQEGVCTRFPIQLELRRKPEVKFEVTITPGESRKDEEKAALREFHHNVQALSQLPQIIQDAWEKMGVEPKSPTDGAVEEGKLRFSDDTLRIHVSGPNVPSLTMLDLPGLYKTSSKNQDKKDREMIKKIVQTHVNRESNIILLVITARHDYENHIGPGIVEAARAGSRTLGVITCPDAANNPKKTLKMVQTDNPELGIQWHCLRNMSCDERGYYHNSKNRVEIDDDFFESRDQLERNFFDSGGWKNIPGDHKGVESLQKKLTDKLDSLIKREYPRVMADLVRLRDSTKVKLENMGKSRSTTNEQIEYLSEMAQNFENIVTAATNGEFEGRNHFFGLLDSPKEKFQDRRLRANIREMNRIFAYIIRQRGKTKVIKAEAESLTEITNEPASNADLLGAQRVASPEVGVANSAEEISSTSESSMDSSRAPGPEVGVGEENEESEMTGRFFGEEHSLKNSLLESTFLSEDVVSAYLQLPESEETSLQQYEMYVEKEFRCWRGKEDPSQAPVAMIGLIFEFQSKNWKLIAETHLRQVWKVTRRFVDITLQHCVATHNVREALMEHIIRQRLRNLRASMLAKLEEILACHSRANPGIMDAYQDLQASWVQQNTMRNNIARACTNSVTGIVGGNKANMLAQLLCATFQMVDSPNRILNAITEVVEKHSGSNNQELESCVFTAVMDKFPSFLDRQNAAILVKQSEAFYEVG